MYMSRLKADLQYNVCVALRPEVNVTDYVDARVEFSSTLESTLHPHLTSGHNAMQTLYSNSTLMLLYLCYALSKCVFIIC